MSVEALSRNPTTASACRVEAVPPPPPLGRHFPEKEPPGSFGQLECVACSKRGMGRVTTTYRCKACKKALCTVLF